MARVSKVWPIASILKCVIFDPPAKQNKSYIFFFFFLLSVLHLWCFEQTIISSCWHGMSGGAVGLVRWLWDRRGLWRCTTLVHHKTNAYARDCLCCKSEVVWLFTGGWYFRITFLRPMRPLEMMQRYQIPTYGKAGPDVSSMLGLKSFHSVVCVFCR